MPKYGLIGYPLHHSFSKLYFLEKFEKEKLNDFSYELYPLKEIQLLPQFIIQNPDLNGFNVTIPYKTAILPFLDKTDPIASETGAVNTVLIKSTKGKKFLKGFNTDVTGFDLSLKAFIGLNRPQALILGTGGASKAVTYVLNDLKIEFLRVSRSQINNKTINYQDLTFEILNNYQLIINTTPCGTFPDIETFPDIPYMHLGSDHYLFDLVYNPSETVFLQKGRSRGCKVKNGLQMLYLQADAAFNVWLSE